MTFRPAADIEADRARYEEHQRQGLLSAPLAMPEAAPK